MIWVWREQINIKNNIDEKRDKKELILSVI